MIYINRSTTHTHVSAIYSYALELGFSLCLSDLFLRLVAIKLILVKWYRFYASVIHCRISQK